MPICPNCETRSANVLDPCPSGDGYYCVEESDFAANRDDDLIGVAVGQRFVVVALLGKGSMAHVYRAHQLEVDRTVALKVFRIDALLHSGSGTDRPDAALENSRTRFAQEAKVLGKLSHPNCVTIYDFGAARDGAYLYIAMEYVGGISLRKAINRGTKLAAIYEIAHQCLAALREAHTLGIVHRDLKPENIILSFRYSSEEPVVKVVDFGIAKLLGRDRLSNTQFGALFGTPAYMSPEQCRGDVDAVGPASDVYALGCILFEMVSARLPFESKSPHEMLRMHQEDAVPELQPRAGLRVPDAFANFIRTSMQKEPSARFADALEALEALEHVISDDPNVGFEKLRRGSSTGPPKRVVVPQNQIAGVKMDVPRVATGASGADNVARPLVAAHVLDTMDSRDGDQPAASASPRKPSPGQGTGVVLLAFFFLIVACVLLFYFVWEIV